MTALAIIAESPYNTVVESNTIVHKSPQIAKFMGPTLGPPGSCRPQMGPMLAPLTLLSGTITANFKLTKKTLHNSPARARYGVTIVSKQKCPCNNETILYRCHPFHSLQWRHNGRGVSNHHPRDCLLNRLYRRDSKKTSKLRVTGLCVGNSPMTGEFPAQMASNAEMFPFDDVIMYCCCCLVGASNPTGPIKSYIRPLYQVRMRRIWGSMHIAIIGDPFWRQWII